MSKTNAIELLKDLKWHCEHDEPDDEFIVGTIDMVLKELASEEDVIQLWKPEASKS